MTIVLIFIAFAVLAVVIRVARTASAYQRGVPRRQGGREVTNQDVSFGAYLFASNPPSAASHGHHHSGSGHPGSTGHHAGGHHGGFSDHGGGGGGHH